MKRLWAYLFTGLFPFLYYVHYVVPGPALRMMSNDFQNLYWPYKGYLAEAVSRGVFPLWSPMEVMGYSLFGNPFSAPLYPLNLICVLFQLVLGRYSAGHHQIFTIMGVSIFCLGLLAWLRAMYGRKWAAVFAASLMAACWGVSGFLRFPNAIHTLAWLPWMLWALHMLFRREKSWAGLALFGAVAMLLTAGYPYLAVYSLLFAGVYALGLAWRIGLFKGLWPLIQAGLAMAMGVMLTAPYWSAVKNLMLQTADRSGGFFAWSTYHELGPLQFLGALAFPPAATIEAVLYVGSVGLFLMLLYFWRHDDDKEKLAVLTGCLAILALAMGAQSAWFTPLWMWLPGLGQMRVFPRAVLVMMPLMALMLHQGFACLRDWEGGREPQGLSLPRVTAVLFAVIISVQLLLWYLPGGISYDYRKYVLDLAYRGAKPQDFVFMAVLSLGAMLVLAGALRKKALVGGAVLALLLLGLSALDAGLQGRHLWSYSWEQVAAQSATPASAHGKTAKSVSAKTAPAAPAQTEKNPSPKPIFAQSGFKPGPVPYARGSFNYLVADYFHLPRQKNGYGMSAAGLTVLPWAGFYYKRYNALLATSGFTEGQGKVGDPALMNLLSGVRKIYFHTQAPPPNAEAFLAAAQADREMARSREVVYYDANRLELKLDLVKGGYLTWLDNWEPGWKCSLDGKPVALGLALGTFKSLRIKEPGVHQVVFSYWPVIPTWAYAAAGLALALFLAWGLWLMRGLRRRRSDSNRAASARKG